MVHEIEMQMHSKVVLNKDVEFDVWADGDKLGSLKVSRGTVEWRPSHHQQGFHVSWEKFDKIMREEGGQS